MGRNNCTFWSSLWPGNVLPLQQHCLGLGEPGHQPEVSADSAYYYYYYLHFLGVTKRFPLTAEAFRDALADKLAGPAATEPMQSVTHRLSATHAPRSPCPSRAQRGWAHTNRNPRPPPAAHAGTAKTGPRVSHVLPPPPRPANIPASKGRKAQPELLRVVQGWSPPGAAGKASLYTSVWGLVAFISQKLSKMLNKSHSIYTWFCRIVKTLVVTLCSFSSWIKRLFLKPALYTSALDVKITPVCLGGVQ